MQVNINWEYERKVANFPMCRHVFVIFWEENLTHDQTLKTMNHFEIQRIIRFSLMLNFYKKFLIITKRNSNQIWFFSPVIFGFNSPY